MEFLNISCFKKAWLLLAIFSCGISFSMDNKLVSPCLPKEVAIVDVGSQADKPTQLSLRATCRYGEKVIKVDELEKGRSYLANPRTFCLVWIGGTERPNHSAGDFSNLKKLFELTDIEARSMNEGRALRSSIVNAIAPWNGARDDSNHGKRTGLYLLAPLYQEDHKKFAAQLKEQHFYNKPRERDEYCTIS